MPALRTTIKRKLMVAIMGTSLTVLVLTCAIFITYEVITFRRNLVQGLTTRAEIVAANTTASLAFENQQDATEVLASFKADPRMTAAALYDAAGELFARHPSDAPIDEFPRHPQADGHRYEGNNFSIYAPVKQNDRRLGTVYLKFHLRMLRERYQVYSAMVLFVVMTAVLVAFILSTQLQRRLAGPILALANTARQVSEQKDYTLKTPKVSDDEIGLLTESFNDMVNEIQRRESALRASEARTRSILESALDSIVTLDDQGKIIDCNPAAETMFGYKRSRAIGMKLDDLILPPPGPHPTANLIGFLTAEVLGTRREMTARRADGTEFPIEIAVTLVTQEGPPLFTVFIHDLTERKRSEERLRLVIEAAPNAMVMVNKNGIITLVNTQVEAVFRYAREELIGQPVEILVPERFHHDHPDYRLGFFGHAQTRKMGAGRDLYGRRKDGSEVPVEIGLNPITTAEGLFVLASIIDITERKRAEEAIRQINVELEKRVAERTSELEAFSYSVSHDLRAPLRAIDGFSRTLLEVYGSRLDEEGRRQLGRVRAASQRMSLLIDALLKLARINRLELRREPIDLSAMASQIAVDLAQSQPERAVTFRIAPHLTSNGDSQLLRVVVDNLLSNAWKYTSKHATALIEFGILMHNGEKVFFVRDDGAGFDMAHSNLLFSPFQRLHRQTDFEGTGVGLATVQRIIRRHGGRLWADGAVEQGATFYFML